MGLSVQTVAATHAPGHGRGDAFGIRHRFVGRLRSRPDNICGRPGRFVGMYAGRCPHLHNCCSERRAPHRYHHHAPIPSH